MFFEENFWVKKMMIQLKKETKLKNPGIFSKCQEAFRFEGENVRTVVEVFLERS